MMTCFNDGVTDVHDGLLIAEGSSSPQTVVLVEDLQARQAGAIQKPRRAAFKGSHGHLVGPIRQPLIAAPTCDRREPGAGNPHKITIIEKYSVGVTASARRIRRDDIATVTAAAVVVT